MSSKQFYLKWNGFQTNIVSAFESLQHSEDLVDVTLTCEGINVKAHKFILSACSPYFRTVFKENPCPHPIVILKDVVYTDLLAIINFMYHGEVMVSEEQLPSFLNTAKLLQVSGLNGTDYSKKSANQKRLKQLNECLSKKPKLISKCFKENSPAIGIDAVNKDVETKVPRILENNETEIKTEKMDDEPDVNENISINVPNASESGSILEAVLDSKRSILERSLMAHQTSSKSPELFAALPESPNVIHETMKSTVIRKKSEFELEKSAMKSPSSESSTSSSVAYERPSELMQQSLQIEGEPYDIPEGSSLLDPSIQIRTLTIPAHHSSQCGKCPHCGQIYSNQSALKYHVRLVHSDLTNMYCCHLCPKEIGRAHV